MSIIMDGATDVTLPFCVPAPSTWKDLHLYKLGVHGIINHGLKKRYVYLHQGQFGCGPDFAISILHQHLRHVLLWPGAYRPSNLYLQFDNCSRENKNKYMLAYCHWLVANKVFHSITMSFLPVGHTHEDVDQMFSGFVSGMHKQPHVNTVEDFIAGLCTWYTVPQLQPIPIFLYEVWSIKSWLEPYLCAVKGTSKPGIFKFELSNDGCVLMSTKDYASTTSGWHEPIEFLSIIPMDSPANLPPATLDEAVLKDTLVALTKMYNHVPLQQSYISLICKFNLPEQDNLIPDPFEWVYTYHHSPDQYIPHPHNGPFNAQMTMSGRATFELIQTLPDIGAIAAFAGENGEYWLGKVMCTTCT
jgi:hypothetical protein